MSHPGELERYDVLRHFLFILSSNFLFFTKEFSINRGLPDHESDSSGLPGRDTATTYTEVQMLHTYLIYLGLGWQKCLVQKFQFDLN